MKDLDILISPKTVVNVIIESVCIKKSVLNVRVNSCLKLKLFFPYFILQMKQQTHKCTTEEDKLKKG